MILVNRESILLGLVSWSFLALTPLLLFFQGVAQAGFIATVSVNVKPLGMGLDEYDYRYPIHPRAPSPPTPSP